MTTTQYYDVLQAYSGPNSQMRYFQQLSQPIIEHANEYYLSIDRFSIPMSNIPIFIFNPAANFYTVELVYNGTGSGPISVQYIPPALQPTTSAYYYYVYSYNLFLLMINTALAASFTALGGSISLPAGSIAPYFVIDDSTKIISLVAQSNFYDSTISTPIQIFMNTNLLSYMEGIPMSYNSALAGGRNILFNLFNTHNNVIAASPSNFYKMDTEYGASTLINWNQAKGFIITTDSIPINPEYLPIVSGQNLLNTRPILANFDFVYSPSDTKGLVAQYILQSPYKTIDLVGRNQVNRIDTTVYWYDSSNNMYTIYLRPNEAMSIRLVFLKKNKI